VRVNGEWYFGQYINRLEKWFIGGTAHRFSDHEIEIEPTLLNPDPSQPIINNLFTNNYEQRRNRKTGV
jgi:hypothetical protein